MLCRGRSRAILTFLFEPGSRKEEVCGAQPATRSTHLLVRHNILAEMIDARRNGSEQQRIQAEWLLLSVIVIFQKSRLQSDKA